MLATEVVDQYLDWLTHEVALCRNPAEQRSRQRTLEYYQHQLSKLKPILPADLLVEDLKAWHLDRSPDRRRRHFLQAAKRVYHWAWKSERIAVCPLRNLELPRARGRKRVLTADEFEGIIRASCSHMQQFIWCLFRTGARPIELRELLWPDVIFAKRILRVENYKGKRLREDDMPAREIPIDEEILELLRQRKSHQERFPNLYSGNHVFTGRDGQALTKDTIDRNFSRACKRAGIDQTGERAVPYTLRHSNASTLTVLGMGQKLLADVLGHADISTTQRYQHTNSADKVAAVDQAHAVGKLRGNDLLKVKLPTTSKNRQLTLF